MSTMSVEYNETGRINALKRYQLLDTPADGSFERMTQLAAKMFNVPIAIISLVDHDRIWFKSRHGLDAEQINRDPGLCASAILSDDVYIVEDARTDPRTLANPLVAGEFGLRFYAAAPLKTHDGHNLGTFCIIDRKQRYMTEPQKQLLSDMAAIAMDEIEIRLEARNNARKMVGLLNDTLENLIETRQAVDRLPAHVKNEKLDSVITASAEIISKIEAVLEEQRKIEL